MNLTLQFNPLTGAWHGLTAGGHLLAVAPTDEVRANTSPQAFPRFDQWRLLSVERRGDTTEVTRQAGEWWMRQTFAVSGSRIHRDVLLRWNGNEPVRIAGVLLRTPVLRLSGNPEDYYLIPGEFPIVRHPFGSLRTGRVLQETGWTRGEYGIALVHSPQRKLSVVAGYVFRIDQARVGVEEAQNGVVLRHGFETLLKLQKGGEVTVGTQVIEVISGHEERLRDSLARFSGTLDNGPPADMPEHLKGASIYELHPWGRLEGWWAGDRGNRFPRLTALLSDLRELGVTMLWLLPVSYPPP